MKARPSGVGGVGGFGGSVPASDARPSDNKCQSLVQTAGKPSFSFLCDIIICPPPEDAASENKYMEEMIGVEKAPFRGPN